MCLPWARDAETLQPEASCQRRGYLWYTNQHCKELPHCRTSNSVCRATTSKKSYEKVRATECPVSAAPQGAHSAPGWQGCPTPCMARVQGPRFTALIDGGCCVLQLQDKSL